MENYGKVVICGKYNIGVEVIYIFFRIIMF